MEKIKVFLSLHRTTVFLVLILGLLGILGWLGVQKLTNKESGALEEVDLAFEPEGPYAILSPRRDGNALILNLKRTASYDTITYELAYTSKVLETAVQGNKILDEGESGGSVNSESIDRGVVGTIDTKEKKGEYEQEILFGTCSKNVCKYDQGVGNGTLTLRIKKGNKVYRMVTQWHLQKPDVALGVLTSGDEHLSFKVEGDKQELSNIGFSIINDLTGVPKLPSGKQVLGKVYSLNIPITKKLKPGSVSLELAENPSADARLNRFNSSENRWEETEGKFEGSKFSGKASGGGIFAVLTPKK